MLLSVVLLLVAIIMISLLNVIVDVKLKDEFFIAFTVSVFSLYLFPKSKKNGGKKQKPNKKKRIKVSPLEIIPPLIEKSRIKITEISIPDCYYNNGILPEFLSRPIILTLLTTAVVYLRTKSEKLYFEEEKERKSTEKLVLCVSMQIKLIEAIAFFFGYLRTVRKKKKRIRGVRV